MLHHILMNPQHRRQSQQQRFEVAEQFSLSPAEVERVRVRNPRTKFSCVEPENQVAGVGRVTPCAQGLAESGDGAHGVTRPTLRCMGRRKSRASIDRIDVHPSNATPHPDPLTFFRREGIRRRCVVHSAYSCL